MNKEDRRAGKNKKNIKRRKHEGKNEFLSRAFNVAASRFNVNSADRDVVEAVMATSIRAYADKRKYKVSDAEIKRAVKEGLAMMDKSKRDFSIYYNGPVYHGI